MSEYLNLLDFEFFLFFGLAKHAKGVRYGRGVRDCEIVGLVYMFIY